MAIRNSKSKGGKRNESSLLNVDSSSPADGGESGRLRASLLFS